MRFFYALLKRPWSELLLLLLMSPLSAAFQAPESAHGTFVGANLLPRCPSARPLKTQTTTRSTCRRMASDDDIWAQQKALVAEMQGQETTSVRQEMKEKFDKRASSLVGETLYITLLIFPLMWLAADNPFVSLSYLIGAGFGLAYTYGLGKYVSSIGGSIDDTEAIQGAGVGQARFAFLILLFIVVGKFSLIEPIPCIGGFFTYQIASLTQGLKEIDD